MKKLKTILQYKYLFKILCAISIIYSLIIVYYLPRESKYSSHDSLLIGKVINYEIDGNKLEITLNGKEKILVYYYFKTEKEKIKWQSNLELGVTLKLNGELSVPNQNTIPNGFNYRDYLKSKNINYCFIADNITLTKNNTSIFYYIKNKTLKRIDEIDNTGYLRTFILGDKTMLDDNISKKYQQNGISHLFSISGMHVSFIVGLFMFILNKISYNNYYKNGIIIPFLVFYLFLTGIAASVLRTVIMYCVFSINKMFNLKIKNIDLMLIVLIFVIIINPYIIYDMGFQFSYMISFTLIMINKKISKLKRKWQQNLYTTIICFLVSFPICIYYYSQVNLLSIFLNLVMIPIVSIIIFPITLFTFVIPTFYPVYSFAIELLENINTLASNIKIFEIVLIKPPLILIIIYYVIIFISIYNHKYILIFVIMLIIHKNYPYFNSNLILTVLDIGQGDSLFIKIPHNKGNILIDTGGTLNIVEKQWKQRKSKNSISINKTIPYMKTLGINKLNYLIITHGDYDHMGEAINLVKNFKVEKVIFNCGEFNELELALIKVLEKKNIPYYSCIKKLNIDNNKLYFLNNKDYGNENDNSSVIYTKLNNYKFLFMGDAGLEVEEDLIEKYNLQDIDVLKVGHHGSKTSSSKKFIDEIEPKYSIISVGKNNRYGHPNEEVLNNLKDSKIYRTDQDGSIMFRIKSNRLKIETCEP